ncbi:MAG TPA: NAD(P)-binding domain-containing protein [Thermoplasmata archaeon]|nr:NAD(P)-binding domain-containing protein [Thermoplasmata archaeon]
MRVGVLGSGDVGRTLATGFAGAGHDVCIGSRSAANAELAAWKKSSGAKVSIGTFRDAAAHGEVVVLATLGSVVDSVIDLAGADEFRGKLVLDATNALDFSHGMPPGLFVGTTDSLGERIQRRLPEAHVVKCFNTVPHVLMVHPKLKNAPLEMLICGNDASAKKRTTEILQSLGWTGAIDVGGIESARWLEALVPLWVRVGATLGTFGHAFVVARS